ncbi:hypothetical protein D3C87_2025940 [compost metagenome]
MLIALPLLSATPALSATFLDGAYGKNEWEQGDKEMVDLAKNTKGYTIRFMDGTSWGPLPKCR